MRSGRGRAECPRTGGDAPAPVPPRRTSASPRRGYGASQPPCSFRVVFVFCAIFARPRFSPRSPGAASQHPFCRVRYLIFRRHLRMKDVQSALERTGVKRAGPFPRPFCSVSAGPRCNAFPLPRGRLRGGSWRLRRESTGRGACSAESVSFWSTLGAQ